MSLKAFHIVFIVISALCAFGFSYWSMMTFTSEGDMALVVAAVLSFACGIGLILYGLRFLKKLKHVSFL
jgi:hypothetical protein